MPIRSVQIMAKQDPDDPTSPTLVAEVERFSQNIVVKEDIHANTHKGIFFSLGVSDVALGGTASLEVLIQTPVGAPLHVRFQGSMGADASTAFFTGTTFSAAGTTLIPENRNQRSPNAARGVFSSGPTITLDGTPLFEGVIPGGSGGSASGASQTGFGEWILESSTNYLMRITNLTGQVQVASMEIDFYDTGLTPYA